MTKRKLTGVMLGLAGSMALTVPAAAGDFIEGEILFELQNDYVHEADDPAAELNDLYATIEPFFRVNLAPGWSIQSGWVFEPVADPDPGEDRAFEDEGLYVETLTLNYEGDGFEVYVGKFNPPFGLAWDLAPGIYGVDFAEDYELTERLGGGVIFDIADGESGTHSISANAFFADTTFLSESAFKNRGDLDESDGGVSNTEDLSSFSLTLGGTDIPLADGLTYTLGLEYQEGGQGDPEDELGLVGGIAFVTELCEGVTLEPIVELAWFDNAEGLDQERTYVTAGAGINSGPWFYDLVYTGRFTDPAAGGDVEDHQIQTGVGYAFDNGVATEVGYRFLDEDGSESHTLGLFLTYTLAFGNEG